MDSSEELVHETDGVHEHERGLSLIEVVISMVLLALLAMAFAPVLIASIRSSDANTTVATATQLVNERMQAAQANGPSCSAVASLAGTATLTDPRGVTISIVTTVAPCPEGDDDDDDHDGEDGDDDGIDDDDDSDDDGDGVDDNDDSDDDGDGVDDDEENGDDDAGTVEVQSVATRTDTNAVIAQATTLVFVE